MAKVATKWLVWVSSTPKVDVSGVPLKDDVGQFMHDRVEVAMEAVVPDTIPMEVQQEWEAAGLIFEDPTKEHIEKQEGPPRMSLPPVMTQKFEHAKKGSFRGGIPPRSASSAPKI